MASVQSHSRTGVVGLSKCFIADATEEEIDQMRRKVWQKIAAEEVPKVNRKAAVGVTFCN